MKIAVLSGKGGAGKTLVAANLSACRSCTYVDCDVEEPNGHLFLRTEKPEITEVCVKTPVFDPEKCTGCRRCADLCRFHALMFLGGKPKLFPGVCHSCGLCALACEAGAVREQDRPVGRIETAMAGTTRVITGILDPGEASGVAVIHAALAKAARDPLTVIDCPPGAACSVTESIADADLCLLVCEATAFGFDNFRMVHELTKVLGRRAAVIVNKAGADFEPLEAYCRRENLPILARLPLDRQIAAWTAQGKLLTEQPQYHRFFTDLWEKIGGLVQ